MDFSANLLHGEEVGGLLLGRGQPRASLRVVHERQQQQQHVLRVPEPGQRA